MAWDVAKVHLMKGTSAFKAEVSMKVSYGFINGFKVFEKDGNISVIPPQVTYKDNEGKTKYKDIVKFNKEGKGEEVWGEVYKKIVVAYKKEKGGGGSSDDDQPSQKPTTQKPAPKSNTSDDIDDGIDVDKFGWLED